MEARLRCSLFPGQFSSELAVVVRSANGRELSLFAEKSDLVYSETPTEWQPVEGWVKVEVVQSERNLHLVRLPQTTLENGQFITVKAEQLEGLPNSQLVGSAP
jgi:hypothetical protein